MIGSGERQCPVCKAKYVIGWYECKCADLQAAKPTLFKKLCDWAAQLGKNPPAFD